MVILQYFIYLLNRQRADLLPLDLHILADIILTSITEMGCQIEELGHNVETIRQEVRSTPSLPSIAYWLGRPATIGDGFVGREAELEMIGTAFEDSQAVVISGGAGSGKSRLAAEYAHQSALPGFWTTAGANVDLENMEVRAKGRLLVAILPLPDQEQAGGVPTFATAHTLDALLLHHR